MNKKYLICPKCSKVTNEERINCQGQAYCEDCDYSFFCMTISYPIILSEENEKEYQRKLNIVSEPYVEINSKEDFLNLRKYLRRQTQMNIAELKTLIAENNQKWYFEKRTLLTCDDLQEELKTYKLKMKIA
jgi:hypothetical protein